MFRRLFTSTTPYTGLTMRRGARRLSTNNTNKKWDPEKQRIAGVVASDSRDILRELDELKKTVNLHEQRMQQEKEGGAMLWLGMMGFGCYVISLNIYDYYHHHRGYQEEDGDSWLREYPRP